MSARRWSLAGRLKRWLCVTTVGLALAVWGASAWFLGRSVEREIDGLAHEEHEEFAARFLNSDGSSEAFRETVRHMGALHPANPLGWRVWRGSTVWADAGPPELLPKLPASPGPLEQTRAPGRELRWRAEPLGSNATVGLLLDASSQLALLRRERTLVGVIAAAAGLIVFVGGAVVSRQAATFLASVTERMRSARDGSVEAELDVEGAPEEIREVVEALRDTLANIRAETERVHLLTAGLAHELRSPIQNLMGETGVALLRDRDATEYRRVLESQVEELHALGRVVDNLVTLCTPGMDGSGERSERFDIGDEAGLRLAREHARAARRGVRLELLPHGDLSYQGDREALMLAIGNLVTNSVDWSPEGGTVKVRIDGRPDQVDVSVEDAGPGVPPNERERIFEAFYQGSRPNGHRSGYGLGLALADAAVRRHRGRITVDDSPQGGARFRVELPRRSKSASAG